MYLRDSSFTSYRNLPGLTLLILC